jgi:hypothetical protein
LAEVKDSEEPRKPMPVASDQPPVGEPAGLRIPYNYTEEFKEALLRAKGEGRALLLVIKDGTWSVDGHVYNVDEVNLKEDTVRLKIVRPTEPTEAKKELVKALVEKLKKDVHGSIDVAIEKALMEKSDGELEMIQKSKTGKITRRRGCFWLEVEETEVLL